MPLVTSVCLGWIATSPLNRLPNTNTGQTRNALPAANKPTPTQRTDTTAPSPKRFLEGQIHFLEGDMTKTQTEFEQARVISEKLLDEAPEDPTRHAQHGLILAALGRKQEAIAEGKRAVELRPESEDAFDGPKVTATLAGIYAWTGEADEALRLLDHLLQVPNGA
jgi:tetratricopeptide (TPR) repeat protein